MGIHCNNNWNEHLARIYGKNTETDSTFIPPRILSGANREKCTTKKIMVSTKIVSSKLQEKRKSRPEI